ncbi:dynamin [Candidatus Gracilibacteria bacterium]|nr:dynamin [Candidatus Gracilibacteria bacterium]NJM89073.1 dynamin [Hydrococcus sp. RU_2_2]
MTTRIETQNFLNNLERIAQVRSQVARYLTQIATTLQQGELEGEKTSGKLALDRDIEDIIRTSQQIKEGVFRLMVLGDMKRGKSTFLNALIGERLLPSDVNPCTAILTVLRYGSSKKVIIYFNDGTPPEEIDFDTFKKRFTINPNEAKKLEREKKLAFPTIDCAVVEYPLSLLEKGVEIVDTPGLNDTEARNEISLNYINNCHAILFVLSATQPCTLGERRYLENYIKNRGLTVFFLINAWDRIRDSLLDPDDIQAVREAEERVRRVFHVNLAEYCQVNDSDLYSQRVFELRSLMALRLRLKNFNASLEKTGFPEFLASLNNFLTKESAISQLQQAKLLASQTYSHVREVIDRRISLLDRDAQELREKIISVEPEFERLGIICDRFIGEIRSLRDEKAKAIADSFQNYFLNIGNSFKEDFLRYQPDLGFLDLLDGSKRQEFEASLRQAFEHYFNDKIAAWSLEVEKEMEAAFSQLAQSANNYGTNYTKVTEIITEKLTGEKRQFKEDINSDNCSPGWANWAKRLVSPSPDNLISTAFSQADFNWRNLIFSLVAIIGISAISTTIFGIMLTPIMVLLVTFGVGAFQMEIARQEVLNTIQKELVKHLPKIAQEQWQPIYNAVKDCFDTYESEVTERVKDDIYARKAELENLLKQKESYDIDREKEITRLRAIDSNILTAKNDIEFAYHTLIS